MHINRRQFLKYCISSAAAMGLPLNVLGKLEHAMAAEGVDLPKVIWINGANCSGCTVSLANLFSDTGPTDIADLLLGTIDRVFPVSQYSPKKNHQGQARVNKGEICR